MRYPSSGGFYLIMEGSEVFWLLQTYLVRSVDCDRSRKRTGGTIFTALERLPDVCHLYPYSTGDFTSFRLSMVRLLESQPVATIPTSTQGTPVDTCPMAMQTFSCKAHLLTHT